MKKKKEQVKKNSDKLKKKYVLPRASITKISLGIWAGSCTGSCLAPSTVISTPFGNQKVRSLKVGDMIWTKDKKGKKLSVPIIQISKTKVPNTHFMIEIILSDMRKVLASPDHPLSDGRKFRQIYIGESYDDSTVLQIRLAPYTYHYTYDILPKGETGFYWANDVLIGSTLLHEVNNHSIIKTFSHIKPYTFKAS